MIEIRNRAGDTIRRSRNLRGILDYARISPVESVIVSSAPGGRYPATFQFMDGSTAAASFADWRVLADWLAARRSWHWGEWRDKGACGRRDGTSGPLVLGHESTVARYYGERLP